MIGIVLVQIWGKNPMSNITKKYGTQAPKIVQKQQIKIGTQATQYEHEIFNDSPLDLPHHLSAHPLHPLPRHHRGLALP
jgi:hypothetical protein